MNTSTTPDLCRITLVRSENPDFPTARMAVLWADAELEVHSFGKGRNNLVMVQTRTDPEGDSFMAQHSRTYRGSQLARSGDVKTLHQTFCLSHGDGRFVTTNTILLPALWQPIITAVARIRTLKHLRKLMEVIMLEENLEEKQVTDTLYHYQPKGA